ncbi:tetratricopeptide repeat protein [Halobacillus trueperi]|uniref:InlB B-repeat-containing protein n=1 Tax=Halobacillus trueperi TaxID=156205 RepID=UPI0037358657
MNVKRVLFFIALLVLAAAATIFTVNSVQANTLEERYELADEAFKAENYQKSVELYSEVLEMEASHREARVKLAQSYIHLNRMEEAATTLSEGIYENPDHGPLYTLLSEVYITEGEIERAYRTLKKGTRYSKDPSVKESYDQLLSHIKVDGERRFVQQGYEREYRLVWAAENGNKYPLEAEWKVENPSVGEIEPTEEELSIKFKGVKAGRTEILITWNDFSKTIEMVVDEQVLEEVTLTPEEMDAFSIGESRTYEVSGTDTAGEVMTFEPKWTLSEEKFDLNSEGLSVTLSAEESGLDVLTISYKDFQKEIPLMVEGESENYVQTNVDGQGRVVVTPDQESYEQGDVIQLQAIGEPGWTFVRWAGDLQGNEDSIEHTLDGDLNVTAIFESNAHQLNLSIEGEGEVFRDSLSNTYNHGETISLRAQPAHGWTFEGWEGDLTGVTTNARLTFDDDKQIRAVFAEKEQEDEESEEDEDENEKEKTKTTEYELNISKTGKGTISKSQSGTSFSNGTFVTLTATPSNGYTFAGWRGDVTHSSRTVTIKVNSDYNLKAVFKEVTPEPEPEPDPEPDPESEPELEMYTLTTSTKGQGSIQVYNQTVEAGESISLQAVPSDGWTFVRWEGDGSGGSASTSIRMNKNKHVTAVFEQVNDETSSEEED